MGLGAYKCFGPYNSVFSHKTPQNIKHSDWHPGQKGHLLRGHSISFSLLLMLKDAISTVKELRVCQSDSSTMDPSSVNNSNNNSHSNSYSDNYSNNNNVVDYERLDIAKLSEVALKFVLPNHNIFKKLDLIVDGSVDQILRKLKLDIRGSGQKPVLWWTKATLSLFIKTNIIHNYHTMPNSSTITHNLNNAMDTIITNNKSSERKVELLDEVVTTNDNNNTVFNNNNAMDNIIIHRERRLTITNFLSQSVNAIVLHHLVTFFLAHHQPDTSVK